MRGIDTARVFVLIGVLSVAGCSQTTHKATSFTRTVTTMVAVNANVRSQVWVSDRKVGTTPVVFPFNYEEEVDLQAKDKNYWETNPGTAAVVTVLSFGTYLPFSLIPVEPTADSRPSGKYLKNKFILRLEAESYEPLTNSVECQGQEKLEINVTLKESRKQ